MVSGGSAVFTGSVLGGSAVASACAELSGVDSFGAVPDCSDWLAWLVWLVWLIWLDWLGWLPGDVTFPVQPVIRSSADSIAILFFIYHPPLVFLLYPLFLKKSILISERQNF